MPSSRSSVIGPPAEGFKGSATIGPGRHHPNYFAKARISGWDGLPIVAAGAWWALAVRRHQSAIAPESGRRDASRVGAQRTASARHREYIYRARARSPAAAKVARGGGQAPLRASNLG